MTLEQLQLLCAESEKWQAETLAELARYDREVLPTVLAELGRRDLEDWLLTELPDPTKNQGSPGVPIPL